MNRITLAFLASAALGLGTARADNLNIRGSVNFGTPGYVGPAPGYYNGAPQGYWRDVPVRVWVPAHWDVRINGFGQQVSYYDPGHYVVRTQRVWVNGYGDRDWREHEWREHQEHERHEHEDRGDWNR